MTRFILSFAAFIMISTIFSSCSKVVGVGPTITETRNITDFSSISLAMDATVNIKQGAAYSVEVSAQDNIMDQIITSVSGSRLTINHKNNVLIKSSPITINITMPEVNGLNVSGSGTATMQNQLITTSLELNVSGSGNISIPVVDAQSINSAISGSGKVLISSGKTHILDSKISGSGDLDMINVQANSVTTFTSGSGTTKVFAVNSLYAKISGSGDVHYRGNPSIDSDISGSGRLIKQ